MKSERRAWLQRSAHLAGLLVGAGLLPMAARAQGTASARAGFDARSSAELFRSLGGSAPVESREVTLTAPDIAENGAEVALAASVTAAGVRRILFIVEKNPSVLSAAFDFTDAVEPNVSIRVKMGQSSNVYAVAMLEGGRVLFAQKDVKVTLGGCGA